MPSFKKANNDGNGKLTYKGVKDEKVKVPKKTFKEEDLDDNGKLAKYDHKYGVK